MPSRASIRLPISTRHAFALAFDLALRRDPLHSLIVPLLLRAPWAIAIGVLSQAIESRTASPRILGIASLALVGDFIVLLVVGAMLRVRARSVFNTPPSVRPAPLAACYADGLRRIPWLVVTEVVRNGALALAASVSILPAAFMRLRPEAFAHDLVRNVALLLVAGCLSLPTLLLGFRLAVATESVVLHEHDLAGAFQRSFRIMRGHFERWLELVAASGVLVLSVSLACAALSAAVPALAGAAGAVLTLLLVVAVTPIIQYAWTFFYLRLVEIDEPEMREAPPAYALAPRNGHSRPGPPQGEPIGAGLRPPGGERG